MCGLAGIFGSRRLSTEGLTSTVSAMAGTLAHRGPDDEWAWADSAAGIGLGFRRLSILDLGLSGRQPMFSADGRFVIVYNGEIYNHRDLRAELVGKGVRFRGTSDTEVILETASLSGSEAAVPRLRGMFAFALWDREKRVLLLARDRVGKKPLYYGRTSDGLIFGSELKALRACPWFEAKIDRNALAAFMRHGYVPCPYSIYEGVRKLPPGCCAVVSGDGEPEVRRYWDPRAAARAMNRDPLDLSDAEAEQTLDDLLRDAVGRRMIADVPLGAMLSGGLDSSTVVSIMQALSPRPVRTFTIGSEAPEYNEAESANAVARHLGTDHTELYVTPDEARAVIPRLPEIYDEPFADSSQIPTFLVSRLARSSVTVSLTGDGGDEVFGGYTRYLLAERVWGGMRNIPTGVRRLLSAGVRSIPVAAWDRLYRVARPWIPAGWRQTLPGDKLHKLAALITAGSELEVYRNLVSLWKCPDGLVNGAHEPPSILTDSSLPADIPDFTNRMIYLDLATYLPDDILVKVDRASMAVGLEVRCPFLDHCVVEWAWKLPERLRKRSGASKWLLRQVLYRYVPRELVDRPKMGFGVPIGAWLGGPLREWAEGLLCEDRLKREGFLNPEPVRRAWLSHLAGRSNEQYRLWAVLMFQAWREHVESRPGSAPVVV